MNPRGEEARTFYRRSLTTLLESEYLPQLSSAFDQHCRDSWQRLQSLSNVWSKFLLFAREIIVGQLNYNLVILSLLHSDMLLPKKWFVETDDIALDSAFKKLIASQEEVTAMGAQFMLLLWELRMSCLAAPATTQPKQPIDVKYLTAMVGRLRWTISSEEEPKLEKWLTETVQATTVNCKSLEFITKLKALGELTELSIISGIAAREQKVLMASLASGPELKASSQSKRQIKEPGRCSQSQSEQKIIETGNYRRLSSTEKQPQLSANKCSADKHPAFQKSFPRISTVQEVNQNVRVRPREVPLTRTLAQRKRRFTSSKGRTSSLTPPTNPQTEPPEKGVTKNGQYPQPPLQRRPTTPIISGALVEATP